jgi:Pretoxin HINT domain
MRSFKQPLEIGNILGGKCGTVELEIRDDIRRSAKEAAMTIGRGLRHLLLKSFARYFWCSVPSLLVVTALVGNALADMNAAAQQEAERLVAAAAQAEISGETARHVSLLHDALRSDPNNEIAHWQLGQIQVDGKWLAVEEAQRRVAADPLQSEYQQRRKAAGATLAHQIALARWCRKNKLGEEAAFHWATVLSLDPNNQEALHVLDLRWINGQLLGRDDIAQRKQQLQAAKDAAKYWEPIIAKWRRAVAGHDVAAHDAALDEIRTIVRLDAIPSIEPVTLGRDANDVDHAEECLQIALAFLDALEKMPAQDATESIVRHAVFSPGNKARNSAIERLKLRPETDYVPMLLSGLAMPIESSFSVVTDSEGCVHYSHTLYREGPDADWSYDFRRSASQANLGNRHLRIDVDTGNIDVSPSVSPLAIAARKAKVSSAYQTRYSRTAVDTEATIARTNHAIENVNTLIYPVLAGTTGQSLADTPKAWWDWWRQFNEYYAGEHVVDRHYDSGSDHYYYGYPTYELYGSRPDPRSERYKNLSCFAKGTFVWTKVGQKPIESLELGDLVLSQEVGSGELAYKPVIAKTIRPPSPMRKIRLESEQITTTLGHPFWVAGVGWRMAKELAADAPLHGIAGASPIRAIASSADAEAYNLVVADFSTYFVGESGILVHDNTPRRSAQVVVPGIAAK